MNCRRWPVVLGKTFALPPARVILLLSKEKWPALSSRRRSLCRPEVRDDEALLRRAVPSVICIVLPSSLSPASVPCRVDRTYPCRCPMQVFPGRSLFLVQVAKQFIKLPLKMGAPSLNMGRASHHGKLLERNLDVRAALLCLVGCPTPEPLSFFYRG